MTGIRSLETFLSERRLIHTLPASTLKGATLGIDASYFVSKMLEAQNQREPLLPAIGGFPYGLEASLDTFVANLVEAGIEPVFVLKGLALNSDDTTPNAGNAQVARRERAWDLYEKQKGDDAVVGFNEAASFDGYGERHLVNLLIARNIRFVIAPFTASAQLALMSQDRKRFKVEQQTTADGSERISVITLEAETDEATIDAIYASTDVLVFDGIDRLITSIDSSATNFQWVSKTSLLTELNLSNDLFTELAVAVGCELNSLTFPLVEGMYQQQLSNGQPTTYIKLALDLIQAHGSIYAAILAFPDTDGSAPFLNRFERGVSCAEYQPVLYASGTVWPYRSDYIPADIHEFVGQRLPNEILFYQSRGLIGPELLYALITAELAIDAPLDGGESKQFRSFLADEQRKLWGYSLNFLAQVLHRYYQYKPVKPHFWYDQPGQERSFDKVPTPLYIKIGVTWRVSEAVLSGAQFDGSIGSVISLLANNKSLVQASTTPVDKGKTFIFESDREILFNTYARALQAAGFIATDHSLTDWGKVLATSLSSDTSNAFDLPLITAIALLQASVLHSKPFEPAYSGAPIRGSPEDRQHTLLVSRVSALLPFHHKPVGFYGPLSRSLLSFQSFVSTQIKTYRWLIETVLISLLANGDADRLSREDEQWWQLAAQLPFSESPSCANGIAVKTYLEETIAHDGDQKLGKESLSKMLQMATRPVEDVSRSFSFFDSVVAGVLKAKELGLVREQVANEFTSTKEWLAKYRY